MFRIDSPTPRAFIIVLLIPLILFIRQNSGLIVITNYNLPGRYERVLLAGLGLETASFGEVK